MRKLMIVIMMVAFFVTTVAGISVWGKPEAEPVSYTRYVVKSGDTLWTIAVNESNGYSQMDARIIISHICEKNECTALIYPGDILFIPQYEET